MFEWIIVVFEAEDSNGMVGLFSDGIGWTEEVLITLVNYTQRTLFLLSAFLSGHDIFLHNLIKRLKHGQHVYTGPVYLLWLRAGNLCRL